MSNDKDREDGAEGSGTDSGGKSGHIEFRWKDAFTESRRDDFLSPNEIKRLLQIHKETHKAFVDKQKQTRQERAALKEGRSQQQVHGRGQYAAGGGGTASPYKRHPISYKAQFSGIDRQVIALPNQNEADTNQELQAELQHRNELQHQHTPKFNPKPRPY